MENFGRYKQSVGLKPINFGHSVRILLQKLSVFFLFIFAYFFVQTALANNACESLFISATTSSERTEVTDLTSLGKAMTECMLLGPEQADVFEIYRRVFFGDSSTEVGGRSLQTVLAELAKHPELAKSHFPEYTFSNLVKIFQTPSELVKYIRSVVNTAGQVRNSLYQIEANIGFWKEI